METIVNWQAVLFIAAQHLIDNFFLLLGLKTFFPERFKLTWKHYFILYFFIGALWAIFSFYPHCDHFCFSNQNVIK